VELVEDRGFDRVTVGELTSRAMVSRAAFYRNYRDKYDLVEQVFDEALAEWFADRMRKALAAMSSEHLPGRDADALVPSVISAMFVQSILWWLEHDRPCPPEEIAEQSSRLIRAVIKAAADDSGRDAESALVETRILGKRQS
jgi:AcrR family transcriptional regulator